MTAALRSFALLLLVAALASADARSDARALGEKARKAIRANDYQSAEELLQRAVKLDPVAPRAHGVPPSRTTGPYSRAPREP